jgi:hypothetical protein
MVIKVAILVDGGFYRKRAKKLWGEKTPGQRAKELEEYCKKHLSTKNKSNYNYLYRIFYYDCPPSNKQVYHPLLKKTVNLSNQPLYKWTNEFFTELTKRRKFALRFGKLEENSLSYNLKSQRVKQLLNGTINITNLVEQDFELDIKQKGVDMKIGLDIASLSHKKQVDRIVLIAGDSDFVPAAKHARREGIDFVLDSMGQKINSDLFEHIDGLTTKINTKNKSVL